MKAVSMDWVKLAKEKKAEYYGEARRRKAQYFTEYNEWVAKNGGPRNACHQKIEEIEKLHSKSVLDWVTHGRAYGEAV